MDETREHIAETDEMDPLVHHEESDVNVRMILWFCVGTVVVALILHIFVGVMFWGLKAYENHHQEAGMTLVPHRHDGPPGPRLQTDPPRDMDVMRSAQNAQLETYGWVDQRAGTVHIPISMAMQKMAAHGMPVRADASAPGSASLFPDIPSEREPIINERGTSSGRMAVGRTGVSR
jgi:hypothetical protein